MGFVYAACLDRSDRLAPLLSEFRSQSVFRNVFRFPLRKTLKLLRIMGLLLFLGLPNPYVRAHTRSRVMVHRRTDPKGLARCQVAACIDALD